MMKEKGDHCGQYRLRDKGLKLSCSRCGKCTQNERNMKRHVHIHTKKQHIPGRSEQIAIIWLMLV